MAPNPYFRRLDKLAKEVDKFEDEDNRDAFPALLKRVTDVVRDAEKASSPKLAEVVERAEQILDSATKWAYTEGDFDFLPPYAYSTDAPLVEDKYQKFGHGLAASFLEVINDIQAHEGRERVPKSVREGFFTKPWPESYRPHPKATRLSRFREGVTPSATAATPPAQMIYQARCEVAGDTFPSPLDAVISSDSSVLAVIAQGGWKHRDPVLGMYLLGEPAQAQAGHNGQEDEDDEDDEDGERVRSHNGFRGMVIEPGLAEVARYVAMDTPRRLTLVADSSRIKSFSWGGDVAFGGWVPPRGWNVHTLKSGRYHGPIAVLPGGRVVRAGKGGAAVWNLDEMGTHEKGRVGKGRISLEDVWRDHENDDIERSTGSAPSTTVAFAETAFEPMTWKLHDPTGHLLCSENARQTERYGCYALDLEAGGKKVSRFLGHGGTIHAFSVSESDVNVFATACSDGCARLYDVRTSLPVMTLNAGSSREFCMAVQLVHPDGIPTVFTGGDRSQSIRLWDIRAGAAVFELATGNNSVCALAWDDVRSTLYAATECPGEDRNGYTHDYRPAKIPRWAELVPEGRRNPFVNLNHADMDVDEIEDEDEEEDECSDEYEYDSLEDDDGEHYWPKDAYHSENHFGYAYDAGEHMLLRYHFKEDPNLKVLPEYGRAAPSRDAYW
ncbi:hypothetical protein OH77DRAFT_1523848 [Trametes cingulata]|nr:hypothetical protein OH77DRAFT_1523848 [Trametes cingulata]